MVRRRLWIWSFLVVPLVFFLFFGCSPNNTTTPFPPIFTDTSLTPDINTISDTMNELTFEKLSIRLSMKEEDIPAQIHVMTSNNSPLPDVITQISTEGQLELDSIDYSNYFILFIFMGKLNFGEPSDEVTQVRQTDNIIYIDANFPKQTSLTVMPGFYYQKFVIKVSKDNMTQFGEITLILLDQDGIQRAITTCEIF